jgi:hypothetical protein
MKFLYLFLEGQEKGGKSPQIVEPRWTGFSIKNFGRLDVSGVDAVVRHALTQLHIELLQFRP